MRLVRNTRGQLVRQLGNGKSSGVSGQRRLPGPLQSVDLVSGCHRAEYGDQFDICMCCCGLFQTDLLCSRLLWQPSSTDEERAEVEPRPYSQRRWNAGVYRFKRFWACVIFRNYSHSVVLNHTIRAWEKMYDRYNQALIRVNNVWMS